MVEAAQAHSGASAPPALEGELELGPKHAGSLRDAMVNMFEGTHVADAARELNPHDAADQRAIQRLWDMVGEAEDNPAALSPEDVAKLRGDGQARASYRDVARSASVQRDEQATRVSALRGAYTRQHAAEMPSDLQNHVAQAIDKMNEGRLTPTRKKELLNALDTLFGKGGAKRVLEAFNAFDTEGVAFGGRGEENARKAVADADDYDNYGFDESSLFDDDGRVLGAEETQAMSEGERPNYKGPRYLEHDDGLPMRRTLDGKANPEWTAHLAEHGLVDTPRGLRGKGDAKEHAYTRYSRQPASKWLHDQELQRVSKLENPNLGMRHFDKRVERSKDEMASKLQERDLQRALYDPATRELADKLNADAMQRYRAEYRLWMEKGRKEAAPERPEPVSVEELASGKLQRYMESIKASVLGDDFKAAFQKRFGESYEQAQKRARAQRDTELSDERAYAQAGGAGHEAAQAELERSGNIVEAARAMKAANNLYRAEPSLAQRRRWAIDDAMLASEADPKEIARKVRDAYLDSHYVPFADDSHHHGQAEGVEQRTRPFNDRELSAMRPDTKQTKNYFRLQRKDGTQINVDPHKLINMVLESRQRGENENFGAADIARAFSEGVSTLLMDERLSAQSPLNNGRQEGHEYKSEKGLAQAAAPFTTDTLNRVLPKEAADLITRGRLLNARIKALEARMAEAEKNGVELPAVEQERLARFTQERDEARQYFKDHAEELGAKFARGFGIAEDAVVYRRKDGTSYTWGDLQEAAKGGGDSTSGKKGFYAHLFDDSGLTDAHSIREQLADIRGELGHEQQAGDLPNGKPAHEKGSLQERIDYLAEYADAAEARGEYEKADSMRASREALLGTRYRLVARGKELQERLHQADQAERGDLAWEGGVQETPNARYERSGPNDHWQSGTEVRSLTRDRDTLPYSNRYGQWDDIGSLEGVQSAPGKTAPAMGTPTEKNLPEPNQPAAVGRMTDDVRRAGDEAAAREQHRGEVTARTHELVAEKLSGKAFSELVRKMPAEDQTVMVRALLSKYADEDGNWSNSWARRYYDALSAQTGEGQLPKKA